MGFSDALQGYIDAIGCTAKELADASGISQSSLSRYLSGDRVPYPGSATLAKLARGIEALSGQRGGMPAASPDLPQSAADILEALTAEIAGFSGDYDAFTRNFRKLVDVLGVSSNALARSLNFDPSYISRILNGNRRPGNPSRFIEDTAAFVSRNYADAEHAPSIAVLAGCTLQEASERDLCFRAVRDFLESREGGRDNPLDGFLHKLDEFDLNDYVASARFAQQAAPSSCPLGSKRMVYDGLEGIMQAELDFFSEAARSESQGDVIMYSDIPMMEMVATPGFPQKWMAGLAQLAKKGLRICSIHDVYRPMEEMAAGLEVWIPLYMTGRVSSYYLGAPTSGPFHHILRSAGTVTASGEAIAGHHDRGRVVMVKDSEDAAYQRERAELLLRCAKPLIRVFDEEHFDGLAQATSEIGEGGAQAVAAVGREMFRNIDISVLPGRYAVVAKRTSPSLAFLIEHPLMVKAIELLDPTRPLAR